MIDTIDKEALKEHIFEYAREVLSPTKKTDWYVCPNPECRSGGHSHANSDSAFHILNHNGKPMYKCHSCNSSGDIFDLCQTVNGVNQPEAFKIISDKYGNAPIRAPKAAPKKEEKPPTDYTEYFKSLTGSIENCNYLDNRGISKEVQRRFNIGYDPKWENPKNQSAPLSSRIIIPTSNHSYTARATDPNNKVKVMKVGNVHLFNPQALSGACTGEKYCFVVEGEIDALSCITVSYNAAGLGGTNNINQIFNSEYFRKDVVLILALDNDPAGAACKEKLIEMCKQNRVVYYPADANKLFNGEKDANGLLQKDRSALETNLQIAVNEALKINIDAFYSDDPPERELPVELEQQGKDNTVTLPYYFCENEKGKISVNTGLLASYIRKESNYIFVRNAATEGVNRFWYKNGCYVPVSDDELKGYIKSFIEKYGASFVKMRDVTEVYSNLLTDRNFINGNDVNSDENIINFKNGLLYLDTMTLKPHSKEVYSTIQIPCNWNPSSSNSPVFDTFLDQFTMGDEEAKKFLLQYLGVCISNVEGWRIKKSLFMVGDGDTGKSRLKKLAEDLIGSDHSTSVTLEDLEKRFGTSNIYNKRIAGDTDMSFMAVKELKMFKQLTGGDNVLIEFKNKTPFNYLYKGMLWFGMNKLPKFGGDRGQWVYNRIIVFNCKYKVSSENKDAKLSDKLFAEREAIIPKAISALKEVINNGYNFDIPKSCIDATAEYQKENDPVQRFFKECCTMRNKGKVSDGCTTKKMYDVFKEWCKDNNNNYIIQKQEFNKSLMDVFDANSIKDLYVIVNGTRYFKFTLTIEAKKEYNHIYGFDSLQDAEQ